MNFKPEIKKALGEDWDNLHPTIKAHYDLSGKKSSKLIVEGSMDKVWLSPLSKVLAKILRPLDALVPYEGENIPCTLTNSTKENDNNMYWRREFDFGEKGKVVFQSRMQYWKNHEIVEYLKFGLGGVAEISVNEEGALIYKIKNYLQVIGPLKIPIPSWLGLGTGIIKEIPLEAKNKFRVEFETKHPIFGPMFGYEGDFEIVTK